MIQLTPTQTLRTGTSAAFASARVEFQETGCLKLPRLVDEALLAPLLDAVDRAEFYERVHHGIGVESCVSPGALTSALEFMLNDPAIFRLIDELTGCGSIGCFEGRVYRLDPGAGHYDSWHSDVGQNRLVAMSINLGREPVDGGLLQIRKADGPAILRELENRVPGDAIIFKIDPAFCHRVGPVTGSVPRTAYAGWFRSQPDFQALAHGRLATTEVGIRD